MAATGDQAELHQEDPGGVDGVAEGVGGSEESEVFAGENLRGSVAAGVVHSQGRQLEGDLERSPSRPLVEEGHGHGRFPMVDGKDWSAVHVYILPFDDSLGLDSHHVLLRNL